MAGRFAGTRALVTGASSGVGLEIAHGLAAGGAALVLPVRNRDRADAAVHSIRHASPDAEARVLDLDLAVPESVTALAESLRASGERIDLLVLNAGIVLLGDPVRHVTPQGVELHLQTNFLGHFALTESLLPLLDASRTRIVVQLSLAALRGGLDDLQSEHRYRPLRAYAASKRALGIWAYDLGRRDLRCSVQLCHPGVVPATGIAADVRKDAPTLLGRLASVLGNTPTQAAETALAALATDAGTTRYWEPSGWLGVSGSPRASDVPAAFTSSRDAEWVRGVAGTLRAGAWP